MKTVLVVDDELAIAEMLCAILEEEGYDVVTVSNGQDALTSLAHAPVDLVISDIMMPFLNGKEFARALRSDSAYAKLPIVLMSAVSMALVDDDVSYDVFLPKPFSVDGVLELVDRLIGKPDS
jgi:two-component system, chemotaxis family, chemotaxis protein CheY